MWRTRTARAPIDGPTTRRAQDAMKKKVPETVGACFDLIERKMFKGPWAMGDTYTVADPYLFTIARWMEVDGVDPAAFPACSTIATGWPSALASNARSKRRGSRSHRLRSDYHGRRKRARIGRSVAALG